MNLKTIPQVARELGISDDTLLRKAKAKGLLTDKLGKAWVLSPGAVMILRRAVKGRVK